MAKNKLDTFKNHLGYDGKKINMDKAVLILNEIGVTATNDIGETPLIIASYLERIEILKLIIEQTQNIDHKVQGSITETALLEACGQRRLESIKLLVDAGANLEQEDRFGLTPLSKIFTNTFSDPIPSAKYLVSIGAKITDKVIKMGMSWNKEKFTDFLKFINYDLESGSLPVDDTIQQKALKIYTSIDIENLHNVLNKNDYFKTAKVIWQKLVPKSGQADTIQGELLRAIEKLRDEAQRNGNINFNKNCHGILIDFLRKHLINNKIFEPEIIIQINSDIERLSKANSPYTDDDIYDRITERIVDWYLNNPIQIQHDQNDKLYC
ncbi:ankyrin repeat domain-containing protein [Flavobacterium flavigenum]|uniref:ankyrin repeat domain-containing protein n=1 Tax=Flavobacterium flavigenum TaxID=3003258 RepID=UPI0022AC71D7|nr:ankyrin repeat domain-containing protein [Flavobacterium flavigenum]